MTRILIPLDGSQLAERAIPHAVAIAGTFTSEIELLGIVDRIQAGSVNSVDWHLSKVQTEIYLSRVAEALDEKGIT
ncbi:MAG: universal stress protein, partial [Wenzhouxiangellaceae bacterium]